MIKFMGTFINLVTIITVPDPDLEIGGPPLDKGRAKSKWGGGRRAHRAPLLDPPLN